MFVRWGSAWLGTRRETLGGRPLTQPRGSIDDPPPPSVRGAGASEQSAGFEPNFCRSPVPSLDSFRAETSEPAIRTALSWPSSRRENLPFPSRKGRSSGPFRSARSQPSSHSISTFECTHKFGSPADDFEVHTVICEMFARVCSKIPDSRASP